MKRRLFLKKAGVLTAGISSSVSTLANISFPGASDIKIVLRGGKCFYENKWQVLDIGINAKGRLKISQPSSIQGDEIIDVTNKIVSPGFIDILSDNSASPQK